MTTFIISLLVGFALGCVIGTVARRLKRQRGEQECESMPFIADGGWGDDTILALSPGALITDEDAVEQRLLNQIELDHLTAIVIDIGPIEALELVANVINTRPSYGMLTVNDQVAHDALVSAIEHLRTAEQLASRPVRLVETA